MKRHLLLAMVVIRSAFAQTDGSLTLEQAIALGRENSRAIRIAAARSDGAAAKAGEADASRLPSLRLYAGYARLSEGNFELSAAALGGRPVAVAPVVANTYSFQVGLQQPLFTGFRLQHASEAAAYQAMASDLDRKMTDADVVLNVTAAYWGLFQAITMKKLTDENVSRLETYVADTERLLAEGLATRNDLLKVQVQLANARVSQIDATNDVTLATMNLNSLLGRPLEMQVIPTSDPRSLGAAEEALVVTAAREDSSLTARALESRFDLRSAAYQADAAEASVGAARGMYWPQLDLSANYYYLRPNSRYQPVTDAYLASWDVAIRLQLDVWNWQKTSLQAEQAEATLKQARQQYAQLRDNIALEVRRAALTLRRSREKLVVATLAVEQAGENRRMTNDRYTRGLATASDLMDAELALTQATSNHTGALVDVALAGARLVRAVGEGE